MKILQKEITVNKQTFDELKNHVELMTFDEHKRQEVDYTEFDSRFYAAKFDDIEMHISISSGQDCYWCDIELIDENDYVLSLREDCDLEEIMWIELNDVLYIMKFNFEEEEKKQVQYLLRDFDEDNCYYAIITCDYDIDLEAEIRALRNKWADECDYSLIEYLKIKLTGKYPTLVFDEGIYTMKSIEI